MSDPSERFTSDRLLAMSDGIFAVALTLLILDIKPPENIAAQRLGDAIWQLAPQFGVFALSFAIVAYFWVIHHLIFLYIGSSDRNLLWANLFFLFSVVVLPFSAALLARYPMQAVALRIYGLNVAICSATLWMTWLVALKEDHQKKLSEVQRRYIMKRFALSCTLSLAGVAIADFIPVISVLLFVAVPVAYVLTSAPQKAR